MPNQPSDDLVRVGTPERERAIGLLNDAFANGYLDVAEFEQRTDLVYGATTRGDLRKSLQHLPNADALFPSAEVAPAGKVVPGAQAPTEFDFDWDSVRRRGSWVVPANIVATGSAGTLDLDFSAAQFSAPVVRIQLQASASSLKLRVGRDHEVRYGELSVSRFSDIKDKAGAPARPGGAVIELLGSISGLSGLVIRRNGT